VGDSLALDHAGLAVVNFLLSFLEVWVPVYLDSEALVLEVPEHVLSHAVDGVLLPVVELRVLGLPRNHITFVGGLVQVEVVRAEHVTAEVLRQLGSLRYFHNKVNVLVEEVFWLFRNYVIIGFLSARAVTRNNVHIHSPVQTETLRHQSQGVVRIHQVRKALQFVVGLPNQQGLHHVVERIVHGVLEFGVLAIFLVGGNGIAHHNEPVLELVVGPSVDELTIEVFHSDLHHLLGFLYGSFYALVVHARLVGCSHLTNQLVGEDHVPAQVLGNLVGFVDLGLDVAGLLLELCTLFILQFLIGLVLHELLLLLLKGLFEGNLLGNHLLLHNFQLCVSALQFVGLLQNLEPSLCLLLLVRLVLLSSLLGQFISLSSLLSKGSLHLSSF